MYPENLHPFRPVLDPFHNQIVEGPLADQRRDIDIPPLPRAPEATHRLLRRIAAPQGMVDERVVADMLQAVHAVAHAVELGGEELPFARLELVDILGQLFELVAPEVMFDRVQMLDVFVVDNARTSVQGPVPADHGVNSGRIQYPRLVNHLAGARVPDDLVQETRGDLPQLARLDGFVRRLDGLDDHLRFHLVVDGAGLGWHVKSHSVLEQWRQVVGLGILDEVHEVLDPVEDHRRCPVVGRPVVAVVVGVAVVFQVVVLVAPQRLAAVHDAAHGLQLLEVLTDRCRRHADAPREAVTLGLRSQAPRLLPGGLGQFVDDDAVGPVLLFEHPCEVIQADHDDVGGCFLLQAVQALPRRAGDFPHAQTLEVLPLVRFD